MPDINIDSIILSDSLVGIGDELIFEVCITNNGDRGDIELYTGFAYQDFIGGPALFLNGYIKQTIDDVLVGESFCPWGEISVTQEVTNAKKAGKDVKFWVVAVPGNSLSKSINIEIPEEPIFCTQYFRIEDQDGNPLSGTIVSPTWDIDLQVPSTGKASLYMEQGIIHTATVYNYEHGLQQTRTFTACTSQLLTFVLDILIGDLKDTSIIIGINPSKVGVGQYSTVSGGLHIEGTGLIPPGLPIKLYIDNGQGFSHIATPNTPGDGTGQFEYYYEAVEEDVNKTLQFKYIYEGSETLKLKNSQSAVRTLTVSEEAVLIETKIELSAVPNTNVEPKTTVRLTAYLTNIDDNPLPDDSFINFYKNDVLLLTTGTIDGYANCNYVSVAEDSEQTISFNAKYLGIENVYGTSEDIINVSFTEYIQPEFGEIGTITYEIIKGTMAADQIEFNIPVTNTSDVERCYYVNLYDENEEHVDKAPETILPLGKFAQKIKAGETENIVMSSVGDWWIFEEIVGQLLTFKLMTDNLLVPIVGACSDVAVTYELAHEITVDMSNTDIIVSICADNTKGLITKDLQIGLMYSDPTTLTKTDVCGSPMNVIDTVSEEICTSYHRPGPFTCSGKAYSADSSFVAYARGFDDEDNEYIVTSPIFKSIYGTKNITVKVTGEPIEECFIDHPTDPTKCLITESQWKVIKWTVAGLGVVYVASVAAPMAKGIGATLEKSQKYKKEK